MLISLNKISKIAKPKGNNSAGRLDADKINTAIISKRLANLLPFQASGVLKNRSSIKIPIIQAMASSYLNHQNYL